MLTPAETRSLALTLALLALGAGAKAWQRAQTRIGPFPADPPAAAGPPAAAPRADAGSAPGAAGTPEDQASWSEGRAGIAPGGAAAPETDPDPASHRVDGRQAGRAGEGGAGASATREPGDEAASFRAAAPDAGSGYAQLGIASGLADPAEAIPPARVDASHPRDGRGARSGAPPARAGTSPKKAAGVKVNLNRASAAELAQVPGIGAKTAQAILEYRKARGPFLDLRELLNVKGIGEKKLERMAPCLILSPMREEEPLQQTARPAE